MIGGSALGIGVTMFLRDQFSAPAARVRGSAQQTTQELMKMQQAQLRQQRNMYAGLAFAGGMAVRRMGKVVGSAAKFGYEMEFVKQISKSSEGQMQSMSKQAMDLGQNTIFYAKDVAEGMRFMAMAGMDYEEVSGNIAAAVNLAAASGLTIAGRGGAADVMTNIMKAFKKEASESSYVSDILAEAATNANLNVFELGEALKYTGSTAMNLNRPLEDVTAMAMTLANAGMQGSMAGVALENSFRYFNRSIGRFASGRMKESLSILGLTGAEFKDAAGEMLPMAQVFEKLREATQNLPGPEIQELFTPLFGVRGQRAAGLLVRNYEEFLGHLGRFQNAQGRASQVSSGMMDTLEGDILRIRAAWKHTGTYFTQSLEPVLRPLLKLVNSIIGLLQKLFSTKILGNFLAGAIAGFLTLNTVIFAFKAISTGIKLITLMNAKAMTLFTANGVAGHNAMTAAASRLGVVMKKNYVMMRASSFAGVPVGSAVGLIGRNKAGRLVRTAPGRTGKAGQFVSGRAAAKYASRFGAGAAVSRGATSMFGRALGSLFGPWGLALTVVLPGLISMLVGVLNKNKEATERGTNALKENTQTNMREKQYTRMGHMVEFEGLMGPAIQVVGTTGVGQTRNDISGNMLSALATALNQLSENPLQLQPIVINIDNEETVNRIFERKNAEHLQAFQ